MIKLLNLFCGFILLLNLNFVAKPNKLFTEEDLVLLEELRIKYYKAVEDEIYLDDFENYVENYISKIKKFTLYETAYRGGIAAVKSKHAFWPLKKLNYLKESMLHLSKAIQMAPDNLEIRFMRFSILHYVPSFLGYSNELEEDKEQIIKLILKRNYELLNKETQKGIIKFMISSERLNVTSTKILEKELASLK